MMKKKMQRGIRKLEDLPLFEIGKVNPELKNLRDTAFAISQDTDGNYTFVVSKKAKTVFCVFNGYQ